MAPLLRILGLCDFSLAWTEVERVQFEEEMHGIMPGILNVGNVEFGMWNLELKYELTG